jgi:DNA-binding transcriptional ArsR family regulator
VLEPTRGASEHADQARQLHVNERELESASRIFRALGDVARLRLVALLLQGQTCVTALAEAEGETLATISQRLRILRNEHIVKRQRRGKHVDYVLTDRHVMALVSNVLAHAAETPSASRTDE